MSRALRSLIALALLAGCANGPSPEELAKVCPVTVSDGRYALGAALEISLCAPDRATGEAAMERLFAAAATLEQMFSTVDPKGDLVRVNRNAGVAPVRVGPWFADVTIDSHGYGELTRGAFSAVRGTGEVDVDRETSTVFVVETTAMLDFSEIERGFALDCLVSELHAAGISRALLAFDQGDLLALGTPAGWDGWGVLLADDDGAFVGTAQLDTAALAVVGSLKEKKRVAIVWTAEAARADALATALLTLGESDGIALLESLPDAEGMLIDASGETWQTSGFAKAAHYSDEWPSSD